MTWDILGILVLLLDLIWIPMQVFSFTHSVGLIAMNWFKMVYWTLDIALCFNTGFYTKDGKVVVRRKLVCLNYMMNWFLFDCFLVGIDWVMVIQKLVDSEGSFEFGENAGAARAGKLARIIRILRLLRLMRLAKLRHLLFTVQGLIDSEWMTIVFVVMKNVMSILALNHYIACLWYLVGDADRNNGW